MLLGVKWGGPLRRTAFADAVLDISAPDDYLLSLNGPLLLELGGTFLGVVIPYHVVLAGDQTVLRVELGVIPGAQAQLVAKAWASTMVQRTHAALNQIRLNTRPLRPTPDRYEIL